MEQVTERRAPNTSTTEEEWVWGMERFADGATAAWVAAKLEVTPAAVNAQRFKRGVYRRDHPVRRRGGGPLAALAAREGAEAEAAGLEAAPALVLPEGADALETADALEAWSQALLRAGRITEAQQASRMARAKLLTLATRRRAAEGAGGWWEDEEEEPFEDALAARTRPVLRAAQTPPEGAWRTWLFLGGRGAGKTLAGAAWLAARAKRVGRLALVGPSLLDAREVMIEGASGLRGLAAAFGPRGERPTWESSRRRLLWSNGAVARVFSAEDPESLRGPQFSAAWADELCAWREPAATLALLRMGLRLGEDPRLMVSTTPRPAPWMRALLAEAGLAVSRGRAGENAAHLAPGFLEGLEALYGGTRMARQELEGEVLDAPEGGVFRHGDLEAARARGAGARPVGFERLVVAVDPPAGLSGAACGIVTVGRAEGLAWVLADDTCAGLTPGGWSGRVRAAAERAAALGPVEVVAEANQGGEMVRQVLGDAGLGRPVRLVRAVLGKRARAEPVGLLYEQGKVAHVGGLGALEHQLLLLGAGGEDGERGPSPDRADALVWGLTELMLRERAAPRIRVL